ncbi:mutagen-sensitive 302 [Tachypleus tridentatus]|uniref:mutagen-sensitive 302 n=1 Tax=Tachypleus tridentatus TaxID=6853 RepID=UPI003FCF98EF
MSSTDDSDSMDVEVVETEDDDETEISEEDANYQHLSENDLTNVARHLQALPVVLAGSDTTVEQRNRDVSTPSESVITSVINPDGCKSESKNGIQKLSPKHKENNLDESEEDGQICTICFDRWTNSGVHRLVSLKCGHLFGFSCIERWLKGQGAKCPQCNAAAKKSEIRTIYAKCLKVLDTSERDRALKELEKEKELRRRAELEVAQTRLKYQMAFQECERIKKELMEKIEIIDKLSSSRGMIERSIQEYSMLKRAEKGTHPFVLEKSLEMCKDGGCRVLGAQSMLGMLVVSQPSPVNLFRGFGIKKVSLLDLKSTEFVHVHSKAIKDLAFHSNDALVLTASLDRTLKLTNVISNNVVQTYSVPADAWSCVWSKDNCCYFYAGLKNGSVLQFDTRMTSGHVLQLPGAGNSSPVVALQYVQSQPRVGLSMGGLLVGQLSACFMYEGKSEQEYRIHPLPVEGNFTSLSYESSTSHILVSCRPSNKQPQVTHMVCELSLTNVSSDPTIVDNKCVCNVVQVLHGGQKQIQISRSRLFPDPKDDTSVVVCGGDESAKAALLWSVSTGKCFQRLQADSPILDIATATFNNKFCLATLTERTLNVYKWTDS